MSFSPRHMCNIDQNVTEKMKNESEFCASSLLYCPFDRLTYRREWKYLFYIPIYIFFLRFLSFVPSDKYYDWIFFYRNLFRSGYNWVCIKRDRRDFSACFFVFFFESLKAIDNSIYVTYDSFHYYSSIICACNIIY